MRTAVDSSVLLDILTADPTFGRRSSAALRQSLAQGALVACGVVWAEVGAFFPSTEQAVQSLETLQLAYEPLSRESALAASKSWQAYRRQGGQRTRMISDFLIGAHALKQADRLLTRDRGFYRKYFSRLDILDPATS